MSGIDLHDGEVQVWWASLDASDAEVGRLRGLLSTAEKRRADRFRIDGAARRFIAARAALRSILGTTIGLDPADVTFAFGERGKPRLADGGPCFNASDSGDFVAIAVTSADVGIDIELTRPLRRRDRLARRICTDRELEALARLPEEQRDARLLRLWTCKEAALKAIGSGLPGGIRKVEVDFPTTGAPKLLRLLDDSDGWTLLFPDLGPNLLCTAVVRGGGWRVVSTRFSVYST
jgi:4'-phosphopantetheinyl transferase